MTTAEVRSQALALVNLGRVWGGKEPLRDFPRGIINHCAFCPLSLATHTRNNGKQMITPGGNPAVDLDELLVEFVRLFDAGEWPDLVLYGAVAIRDLMKRGCTRSP